MIKTKKYKNKKYRKTKTTKGGQIVNYTDADYKSTHIHCYDCAPSVFFLLGYGNEDTAIYMAALYPYGMTNDKVIDILNLAYHNNSRWVHVTGSVGERLKILHTHIKKNQATIASYGDNFYGHYFAVYNKKMDETEVCRNCFFAIDPQQDHQSQVFEYLLSHGETAWGTFYIIVSDSVVDGQNLVTKDIVDEVTPISIKRAAKLAIEYNPDSVKRSEHFAALKEQLKQKIVFRPTDP